VRYAERESVGGCPPGRSGRDIVCSFGGWAMRSRAGLQKGTRQQTAVIQTEPLGERDLADRHSGVGRVARCSKATYQAQ
jgi:hypothetical protein